MGFFSTLRIRPDLKKGKYLFVRPESLFAPGDKMTFTPKISRLNIDGQTKFKLNVKLRISPG
jgi:hypothetical protein